MISSASVSSDFTVLYKPYFIYYYLLFISKTNAIRITKLDIEMFHHESQKFVYFEVSVLRHKNIASMAHGGRLCVVFV